MSKADYPYPDDEFDAPPDPSAPRSVHRAPRSAWSRWWPFLAVLVLAPLVAYGLVTFMARSGNSPVAGFTDGDDEPSITATTDAPTDEASEPQSPSADPTTEAPPAAQPVLSTPVTVLNAAGVQGLAAKGAAKLTSAGFTSVKPDNFRGAKPAASVVYYASDALKPTADLVASTLGVATVTLAPQQAGTGISVVLVTDLS